MYLVRTEQSIKRSACAIGILYHHRRVLSGASSLSTGRCGYPYQNPARARYPPHQSPGGLHLASSGVANDLWAYVAGPEQSNFSHTRPIARSQGFAHQGGYLGMSLGAVTQLVECQLCKLEVGRSSRLRSIASESPKALFFSVFSGFLCAHDSVRQSRRGAPICPVWRSGCWHARWRCFWAVRQASSSGWAWLVPVAGHTLPSGPRNMNRDMNLDMNLKITCMPAQLPIGLRAVAPTL